MITNTIKEYQELKHKVYDTYNIETPKGNVYSVYYMEVTTYSGLMSFSDSKTHIITDTRTGKETDIVSKANTIAYLNRH